MLDDFWRDFIAISGFVLTSLGLVYAIIQIRKTKSAVQAAREATTKAILEAQLGFQKYVGANAHRFISQAKIHLAEGRWDKAAVRIDDAADQVSQLTMLDPEWQEIAKMLRQWANLPTSRESRTETLCPLEMGNIRACSANQN